MQNGYAESHQMQESIWSGAMAAAGNSFSQQTRAHPSPPPLRPPEPPKPKPNLDVSLEYEHHLPTPLLARCAVAPFPPTLYDRLPNCFLKPPFNLLMCRSMSNLVMLVHTGVPPAPCAPRGHLPLQLLTQLPPVFATAIHGANPW